MPPSHCEQLMMFESDARALFWKGEKERMNAFELLKADHEKVSALFEKLDSTTERATKTREDLFTKLKQELELHTHIEETIFYPSIESAEETRELTLEAYEEHNLVKQLLSELEAAPKDVEEWTAKLTVLKENVEHHVEEEEGELFKKARKVLSESDIETLGQRMQEAKGRQDRAAASR